MLLFIFFACFVFLASAQITNPTSTQSSISSTSATSVVSTTQLTSSLVSASTSTSTSTPISRTPTTATTPTTLLQGPVGQPAPTTGTPGGPTPYTYSTVINGVTQVLSDVFTPTSPVTVPVTPSAVGTILNYSSWLAVYGPTQKSSAGGEYPLHPIPFSLILVVLSGILGGGGMLIV